MRFEPRENVTLLRASLAPISAVFCALLICAVLIAWTGTNVLEAYGLMFKGAFGSGKDFYKLVTEFKISFALKETITRSIPLIFTGLAAAVAFRSKFYNIGAEGQLYCGALAATVLGTGMINLPGPIMVPFLMLAGALAGGALLVIPVLLKTQLKVDEVVTTLLMNFIVLGFVSYLLDGPLRDLQSMGWPQAASIIDEGRLPKLLDRGRLHAGLIFALASCIIMWAVMRFTTLGYRIRAVGSNDKAAEFSGILVRKTVITTAMLSGGFAGMAGVSEVAGLKGYLTNDLALGFGYTGIAVAMLAQLHPLAVIPSALFLSAVYVGADSMSRAANIPTYISDVLVGVSVLSILVSVMLTQFKVRWR